MEIVANNIPKDYHILDHVPDWMESAFYEFVDSKARNEFDQFLQKETKISWSGQLQARLNFYSLEFKPYDGKHLLITIKDAMLLMCAIDVEVIIGNKNKSKEVINRLNELYFEKAGYNVRYDILLFHIANIVANQRWAYLYVYDNNIFRFANIMQHHGALTMANPQSWYIQINLPKIIYKLMKWKDAPSMQDHIHSISGREQALLMEMRFQKYDIDNIRIGFDVNWLPTELKIEWKEFDLNRYSILNKAVDHWSVGHKKYKWKKQYIEIKETIRLDNEKK